MEHSSFEKTSEITIQERIRLMKATRRYIPIPSLTIEMKDFLKMNRRERLHYIDKIRPARVEWFCERISEVYDEMHLALPPQERPWTHETIREFDDDEEFDKYSIVLDQARDKVLSLLDTEYAKELEELDASQ